MTSSRRVLVVALGLIGGIRAAEAGLICSTLGAAANFNAVTAKNVRSTPGFVAAYNCNYGVRFGSVCTTKVLFQLGEADQYSRFDDTTSLVASRPNGVAVTFAPPARPYYVCGSNRTAGDVVTGGGRVQNATDYSTYIGGVVDTSGTHPALGACNDARAAAVAASATFAAMAPAQTFGVVEVKRNEFRTLDIAGGTVVSIDKLILDGPPIRNTPGNYGPCLTGPDGYADLLINLTSPGDVVLNIGTLTIGSCGYLEKYADGVLLNVPGKGRRVQIGSMASVDADILAPLRTINFGGSLIDYPTMVGDLWGKTITSRGYAEQEGPTYACP